MKSLTLLFYCILCFSVVSCTRWPEEPVKKQKVVYLSSWQNDWKRQILSKCNTESAILTIQIYEAEGRKRSKEQVETMGRMLLWSCYKFYKISI